MKVWGIRKRIALFAKVHQAKTSFQKKQLIPATPSFKNHIKIFHPYRIPGFSQKYNHQDAVKSVKLITKTISILSHLSKMQNHQPL